MTRSFKTPSKKEAADIIDRSMKSLGFHMNMKTDVKILKGVLHEMKLHEFKTSYKPMKQFFDKATTKPQSLKPLLENVKWGLVNKHPAVIEFAKKALEKDWFSKSKYINKSVHVAFILEAMTAAMANSNIFFAEAFDHLRAKEREVGIDVGHIFRSIWRNWPMSGNFFGTAKAVSLDPAMAYFRIRRELDGAQVSDEKVKEIYKKGNLSYFEYKLLLPACKKNACHCSDWLRMNIYEAGVTEYSNGYKSNAISAHALSEDIKSSCHRAVFKPTSVIPEGSKSTFYTSLVEKGNTFPTFSLNKDWVSLYETWNMAFILGELENLHFLFPKLLIPSVLNAKSENFLGVRIISLWLSINNTLFLRCDKKEKVNGPIKRKEIAQAWGKINEKYAFKLAKKRMQENSNILKKSFQKKFAWPFYNLAKLIFRFLL